MELKDLPNNPNEEKILKSLEFLKKQQKNLSLYEQEKKLFKEENQLRFDRLQDKETIPMPSRKSFLISSEPNQEKVVALPKRNKIHKEIFEKVKVQDTN